MQINEHFHEKVEFMAISQEFCDAAVAKRVGANVAGSTRELDIALCRGEKDFSRIRSPNTRRFE